VLSSQLKKQLAWKNVYALHGHMKKDVKNFVHMDIDNNVILISVYLLPLKNDYSPSL